MPEPDFARLKSLLERVQVQNAEALSALTAIANDIDDQLALNGGEAALAAHRLVTRAAALLRFADAHPEPRVLAAMRWAARLTFASLLANGDASAADLFGRCANTILDKARDTDGNVEGIVYFVRATGRASEVKIGFTMAHNFQNRLRAFNNAMPYGCDVVHSMPGTLADEGHLHQRFEDLRVSPNNEWFYLREPLRSYIEDLKGAQLDDS